MSVRAYKVNRIEHEGRETFNLWYDEEVMEWLGDLGLNEDGFGLIEVRRKDIEGTLEEGCEGRLREVLEKMLEDCGNEDYVQYYCF